MSSHPVDGVLLPLPVAGHPGAEFCNTRAGWGEEHPREYLVGYDALALWVREAGLLPAVAVTHLRDAAAHDAAAAGHVLGAAVALREDLYPVLLDGVRAGAGWDRVAGWAARARAAEQLLPVPGAGAGRPSGAHWSLVGAALELPLLAVAAAAADLLVSTTADAVGACPGAGCGWLFVDPSHRRRWCSMAVCGNRAKARRYAARTATAPAQPSR